VARWVNCNTVIMIYLKNRIFNSIEAFDNFIIKFQNNVFTMLMVEHSTTGHTTRVIIHTSP
jgi:hypothetical protein